MMIAINRDGEYIRVALRFRRPEGLQTKEIPSFFFLDFF